MLITALCTKEHLFFANWLVKYELLIRFRYNESLQFVLTT
jgi:hypothetical protein